MKKNKFLLVLFSFLFAFNSIFAYNSEDLQIQIGVDELINCCGEDFIEKIVSAHDLANETSIIIDGIKTNSAYIIVVVKSKNGTKVVKKILIKK
jgi:predicted KAP-like P-loop ATPase